MAYATTVYPAKVALHALLNAWSWPEGAPTVLWGQPLEADDITFDAVYQGAPETLEDEYVTLGAGRLDENYDLVVVVDVRMYGNDEQATEARAWSHANQLVTLLNQNKTLSGTVNRVTGFRFQPVTAPSSPQQWRSQIVVRVAVVGYVPLP